MKKLSLVVVVLGLAALPGCWKKKAEEVKPEAKMEVPAPVAQTPAEPVRESTPAPAMPAPAAEATPAPVPAK